MYDVNTFLIPLLIKGTFEKSEYKLLKVITFFRVTIASDLCFTMPIFAV